MSLRLIKAIAEAENADDLHLARILFLLNEAGNRATKKIDGITKLAKLDFLLRYPNCLERVVEFNKRNTESLKIKPFERTSIESKMVRFRYGPWDNRYRKWIGILVAKGLATTEIEGRTVKVGITEAGRNCTSSLADLPEFADFAKRSNIIFTNVGNLGATSLKDFIYRVFPEIISLKWGTGIEL